MKYICTGATFLTYGYRKVSVDFAPFSIDSGKVRLRMERLADEFSHMTQQSDDPITKCLKLKLQKI